MNRLTRRANRIPLAQLMRAGAHHILGLGWYLYAKTQKEVQEMRETGRDPVFLGRRIQEAYSGLCMHQVALDIAFKKSGIHFYSTAEAVEYFTEQTFLL